MELLERLAALEAAVAARDARITALEAENAELRCRLGQSPRNSNMPPEDFISSLAGATQILRLETHGVCALICVAEITTFDSTNQSMICAPRSASCSESVIAVELKIATKGRP
jgi:hypothetical protein